MTKPKQFLVCAHCKAPFARSWKRQKYCSTHCAIYSRIEVRGPSDCWEWTGGRHSAGYGHLGLRGENAYAHRLALELSGVDVPTDLEVLHSCDNPPCCNPAHLSVGTHAENLADMRAKERGGVPPHRPGEQNGAAKITAMQAQEIRDALAGGETQRAVASQFGISQAQVHRIKHHRSW